MSEDTKAPEPAPAPVPTPPRERTCKVENILDHNLIKNLGSNPTNATFRAQARVSTKLPLPPEADTWDKIKDWIEFNVVYKASVPAASKNHLVIPMYVSVREFGRCNYRCDASGTSDVHLGTMRVSELLNELEAGDGVGDLVEKVIGVCHEFVGIPEVRQRDLNYATYSDYEVEEEEVDITQDMPALDYSENKRRVTEFLRQHFPNALAQLESTEGWDE